MSLGFFTTKTKLSNTHQKAKAIILYVRFQVILKNITFKCEYYTHCILFRFIYYKEKFACRTLLINRYYLYHLNLLNMGKFSL